LCCAIIFVFDSFGKCRISFRWEPPELDRAVGLAQCISADIARTAHRKCAWRSSADRCRHLAVARLVSSRMPPIQYRCLILEHTTRPRNSLPVAAFSPRFRSAVFSQSRTWRGASEPILVTHNPKGRRRATRSALDLALATNLNCSATRPVHYSDGDAVPHLSAQTEPPLLDLTQPSAGLFFA
jgi:hypothetical protein